MSLTSGELHDNAMELAELADVARLRKDYEKYNQLILQAYELEAEAAYLLSDSDNEPTRSVLFRSAATLAVECKLYREAERLVSFGLIGNPPGEIIEELRAVLENIHFELALAQRGIKLEYNDIQIAISGKDAGYGIASSDIVLDRLQNLKNMVHRTIERMRNKPYREGGAGSVANEYPMFLKAVAPGSFEITLSIGEPQQIAIPGFSDPVEDIIKEIFTCIEMTNQADEDALRQRIPDEAYYNNFVSAIKQIAPDGESVASVRFSAMHNQEAHNIVFERKRKEINISKGESRTHIKEAESKPQKNNIVQIKGILRFADGLHGEHGSIRLLADDGTKIKILVPKGMDDIVGPYWAHKVLISGEQHGKSILLNDIEESE